MCIRMIFILFVLSFIPGSLLHARIIHVPSDSSTIQGGINGASEGDTVMVAPGTYYENDIDFLGKRIIVMGTNPEDSAVVATTIVDADSSGSVFVFQSGEGYMSVLKGLTIQGGISGQNAGGVVCDQSSPQVRRNVITDNHGFGVNLRSSDAWIKLNTISENRVGVVSISSTSSIHSNTIENNSNPQGSGGGIFAEDSDLLLGYNIIRGNSAVDGAGIYSDHSTLYIHDISIMSPCIDAGDPGMDDDALHCDMGLGGSRCDMGVYGGLLYLFIRDDGSEIVTLPKTLVLAQNYPNPFNPSTTIRYEIPRERGYNPVELSIYDIRGRQIRKLVDEEKAPGKYQVHWDGRDDRGRSVSSGIYLYRIKAGADVKTRKMVIIR